MDKKIISIGAFTIFSAIIWGAVILGCSFALKGTGGYEKIQNILGAGAAIHLILIWGPLATLLIGLKEKATKDTDLE